MTDDMEVDQSSAQVYDSATAEQQTKQNQDHTRSEEESTDMGVESEQNQTPDERIPTTLQDVS